MRSSLLLLFVLFVAAASSVSIGDGLWRTFNLALLGKAPTLPLTRQEAEQHIWEEINPGYCDPNLGIGYAFQSNVPKESTPLVIYYTAAGQVAGVGVVIFGEDAAPQNLVDMGFWLPMEPQKGEKYKWGMTVSFRSPQAMCSKQTEDELVGDRLVINQGTSNYSLPLTAAEAYCGGWTFGSCMKTMGQHWFYDVVGAPHLTWDSANLLPVVPMYYPPNINGTINAFFFTTPLAQPGSDLIIHKPGDWETPALTTSQMCENFCSTNCTWSDVDNWSTMHIYLNSQWSYISCEDGEGPLSIYCPEKMYTKDIVIS